MENIANDVMKDSASSLHMWRICTTRQSRPRRHCPPSSCETDPSLSGTGIQVRRYPGTQLCRYAAMQVCEGSNYMNNLNPSNYLMNDPNPSASDAHPGSIPGCKYASMQVCKYTSRLDIRAPGAMQRKQPQSPPGQCMSESVSQ